MQRRFSLLPPVHQLRGNVCYQFLISSFRDCYASRNVFIYTLFYKYINDAVLHTFCTFINKTMCLENCLIYKELPHFFFLQLPTNSQRWTLRLFSVFLLYAMLQKQLCTDVLHMYICSIQSEKQTQSKGMHFDRYCQIVPQEEWTK